MGTQESARVISFVDSYFSGPAFDKLFNRAMDLVDEIAGYLHGQGIEDQKFLSPALKMAYATETMRLTTRLMQATNWLHLMRGKKEGMSATIVLRFERHLQLDAFDTTEQVLASPLPAKFIELIKRSLALMQEIRRLDKMFFPEGITIDLL